MITGTRIWRIAGSFSFSPRDYKFVATQDSPENGHHGDLSDLNNDGKKLQKRDARTGSSEKKSEYLEIDQETKDELRLKQPNFDDEVKIDQKSEEKEVSPSNSPSKNTCKKMVNKISKLKK